MPRVDAEPNPSLWLALSRQVRREEFVCWICDKPIDFDAPARTRWSFSVDHVKPKSKHPELRYTRTNLRAAHYGCNSRKKDHAPPEVEPQSRVW